MDTTTTATPNVRIGQGAAIHRGVSFTYPSGSTFLGAACDQHGFARLGGGRKVRPVQDGDVTCRRCLTLQPTTTTTTTTEERTNMNDTTAPEHTCQAAEEAFLEATDEYARDYMAGWKASTRVGLTGNPSRKFEEGRTTRAWEDGYHDQAAGREKWHLRDCPNHDTCGE